MFGCRRFPWLASVQALALLCVAGCTDAGDGDGAQDPTTGSDESADGGTVPAEPIAALDAASASDVGPVADASGDDDAGDATAAVDAPSGDALVIDLEDGRLRGDPVDGTRRFLKIPFAKPPVGELRWQAPVKNEPWTGTRHEADFSEPCSQASSRGSTASMNEDCLYLNVWSPQPPPTDAPVMVWFHGGANMSGSTRDLVPTTEQLWFDGQFFAARHGIVVVTTNYRLGPLGFFAHPDLPDEGSPLGNQGLRDQIAAMQWVRDNIAQFGGDPNNVTIFGESAGASDVCYHVASPLSRGLFHRAISQSGGCTVVSGLGGRMAEDAASHIASFTEAVGCSDAADQLACLREKSAEEILTGAADAGSSLGTALGTTNMFGIVVDGDGGFLPERSAVLFERGEVAQVPLMLGSNTDEGRLFVLGAEPLEDEAAYMLELESRYGEHAAAVAAQYPASDFDGDYDAALARAVGDQIIVCSSHDAARHAARAGLPVFMYNFNVVWAIAGGILGVSHAGEISHVFGNPLDPTEESQMVSDAMNAYWARFAATGDPNGPDAPAVWPAFGPDPDVNDRRLQLDPNWEVLEDFRVEECALWRSLYAATSL